MKLTSIILSIFLISLTSILAGCDPKSKVEDDSKTNDIVRIGTADGNGRLSGLFGLAKQLGYLKEELALVNSEYQISGFAGAGPAVNEALASNALDVGAYADLPAILAAAKGVNTQLIMTSNAFINANIAVRSDSNIHSLGDLVNKRVALPRGTYMQRYFTSLVQENGYSINDFNIIQMTNDAETALVNGSIDAMVWTENATAQLQDKYPYIKVLYSSSTEPDLAGISVVVANKNYIQQHPDIIKALFKALVRAADYAKENPKNAENLLAIENHTSINVIHATHNFYDSNVFAQRYSVKITDTDKLRLAQTQQFMLEQKIINIPLDIDKWIYTNN